jgi:L-threonylcarbamoyladenylate synthase
MKIIKEIIQILNNGGVVILPTDTVYGLFCRADNKRAVKNIYKIKGRDFKKPLQVFLPDVVSIARYVMLDKEKQIFVKKHLPGPYTIILKLRTVMKKRFSFLRAGTIGIRVVNIRFLKKILGSTGPLAATSANLSGGKTPVKFDDISWELRSKAGICLINDRIVKGRSSKVIDITGKKPEILRV